MLSYATLDKCTHAYRRGYRAGYEGAEMVDSNPSHGLGDRPFADHDFIDGYNAGQNDAYWDAIPWDVRRNPDMRQALLDGRPKKIA